MEKKTIIILGMHRSGTSMMAGALHNIGINMGQNFYGKLPSNPLGHFEDMDFLNLNNKILEEIGTDWRNPPHVDEITKKGNAFSNEIQEIISKKNKQDVWGWKDPRTCLTLELFIPYVINPYFIVCYRDAFDVANSLYKREKMDIDYGIKLKDLYDKRINMFFNKYRGLKRYNVKFQDIKNNPSRYIEEIINFLDMNVTNEDYVKGINFVLPSKEVKNISKKVLLAHYIQEGIKKPWLIPKFVLDKMRNVR